MPPFFLRARALAQYTLSPRSRAVECSQELPNTLLRWCQNRRQASLPVGCHNAAGTRFTFRTRSDVTSEQGVLRRNQEDSRLGLGRWTASHICAWMGRSCCANGSASRARGQLGVSVSGYRCDRTWRFAKATYSMGLFLWRYCCLVAVPSRGRLCLCRAFSWCSQYNGGAQFEGYSCSALRLRPLPRVAGTRTSSSSARVDGVSWPRRARSSRRRPRRQRPNKRLMRTGHASREQLRCLARAVPRGAPVPCAPKHVARSLSAVR